MIRIDQLIESEPNICFVNDDQKLYRAVALMNAFGFIWSFPFWIIYAFASLSNGEQSIIFFAVTLIFVVFHIICSIPAVMRIYQSAVQRTSMELDNIMDNEFGYSFLSESIENDLLSPNKQSSSDKESDDPILYTAPLRKDEKPSNISSMNQLIMNKQNQKENDEYRMDDDADISEETEEADGRDGI